MPYHMIAEYTVPPYADYANPTDPRNRPQSAKVMFVDRVEHEPTADDLAAFRIRAVETMVSTRPYISREDLYDTLPIEWIEVP